MRLAPALAALACAGPAYADELQDRIAALVAADRAREALPLALARARATGADIEAWEQVATLAGWTSSSAEALEASAALVALRPEDRARRLELARLLLWARRAAEALPHARWLVASPAERDPQVLEVAVRVFADGGAPAEAVRAAERWVEVSGGATDARWALADLTHWSWRWRTARAQYAALRASPTERARTEARAELLRHDHPTLAALDGVGWQDNQGVVYVSAAGDATVQLPAPAVLVARAEAGRWAQRERSVEFANVQAGVRLERWDAVRPEATAGVEHDTEGHVALFGNVGVRFSLAGRVFGRLWLQSDRYRAATEAIRQDVRATGPAWTVYAEPRPWMTVSSEASLWWLSDGNLRGRALLAAGVHNLGRWQAEPRAWATYEGFRALRAGALPYFTPTDPWTWGCDLTLRYTSGAPVRVEVSAGFAVQGGTVLFRPSATVRLELARHLRIQLTAAHVGSPQYQQTRVDGGLAWLF